MKVSETKIFKRRDSATALLRKIGIKTSDYSKFILPTDDGQFECYINKAEQHLLSDGDQRVMAEVSNPVDDTTTGVTKVIKRVGRRGTGPVIVAEVPKKKNEKDPGKISIASFIKGMILKGSTNEEVWIAMKDEFDLRDNSKKHYPSWYRSQMKRAGQLNGK